MPHELFDSPFAAPMPVAQPPLGPDAMMHERSLHGTTPWSFATPGTQDSHHAFTLCDADFA